MDFFDTRRSLELSGIHPEFGIPDNASINTKLHDFNQMYQKFASGLFELAYPALPPGHPLYSRRESTVSLQSENKKLKKENIDLKKQLSNNKKQNKKNY
jgi:hypothetical protein